jgi:hypothetical protein
MWNYLGECMGIAVQTAIGGFCWLVVVMAFVTCIGIVSYLFNREPNYNFNSADDFRNNMIDGGKDD